MHQNEYLWSKGLSLYFTIPTFNNLMKESLFENIVRKGEVKLFLILCSTVNTVDKHFLLFPQSFLL